MHYSNTGYLVLAQVVQKASGMPFDRYVTETLLKPAGMIRSGVFDGRTRPADIAPGYTYGDLGWDRMLGGIALTDTAFQRVPELPLAPPAGDAGVYSTALDLARWSRALDRDPLATRALTPGPFGYAAGWIVDRAFNRTRQHHGGILPGALSSITRFPDDSLTIVVGDEPGSRAASRRSCATCRQSRSASRSTFRCAAPSRR
jgi:CubicO group peptidase (beta-lactamase class C family)